MSTTSPFRTSADLILAVIKRGRVTAVGQAVDPDDYANVSGNLDSIFRKVAALEIAFVGDRDNIPGEWFSDLVDIVLGECASDLGMPADERAALVNKGLGGAGQVPVGAGSAAQSLKIISRGRPTYETFRMQTF